MRSFIIITIIIGVPRIERNDITSARVDTIPCGRLDVGLLRRITVTNTSVFSHLMEKKTEHLNKACDECQPHTQTHSCMLTAVTYVLGTLYCRAGSQPGYVTNHTHTHCRDIWVEDCLSPSRVTPRLYVTNDTHTYTHMRANENEIKRDGAAGRKMEDTTSTRPSSILPHSFAASRPPSSAALTVAKWISSLKRNSSEPTSAERQPGV